MDARKPGHRRPAAGRPGLLPKRAATRRAQHAVPENAAQRTRTLRPQRIPRTLRILRPLLLALALLFGLHRAAAQYYSWGADAPMKWSNIRTPEVRVIHPDTLDAAARRTLCYIDAVRPSIAEGFTRGPMRIPFVLHPENFQSNGLVMYLPKRVELLTIPPVQSYSMPWLKQLAAHEYRHAVQYNNLDRGVIRALSCVLGQQGSTVGLLCMPVWALEGDAVMSETAMSSFGRGLQPSFTLGYRAMGRVGVDRRGRYRKNTDKWFCGSYRDYIPDHYELGYQLCSYAYDRYGENVWNRVARFASRNPYLLATTRIALEKYYNTNVDRLFRATFDDLQRYWDSLPQAADSARPAVELDERNYTVYQWPLELDDTTSLALRTDYDRPARFVALDLRTGRERTVARVGLLSTRPMLGGGRLWWTEYRRSKLFEERVHSQLCYLDMASGRTGFVRGRRNVLYPTPTDDGLFWAAYRIDGSYAVESERGVLCTVPAGKELHGLAWDDLTVALYTLVTDDDGMWIARVDTEGLHPVTAAAYITLSDLRAGGGRLYFGSIASGKDEVHCYDLAARQEYRLTTSAYGSFDGAPARKGREVLLTTYSSRGYRVALQPAVDTSAAPVAYASLPENVVNPPHRIWPAVNLDTVRFAAADTAVRRDAPRAKRYRKGLHLFNVHSWMPLAFDPFAAVDEHRIDVQAGVTLLSQNLLSSTEAYASYGWNRSQGSIYKLGIRYTGLGVHLDLDASFGGDQLFYSVASRDPHTGEVLRQQLPAPEKYRSVGLTATLPLWFQRGYHTRILSLSAGWNYSNGRVADMKRFEWSNGYITNIREVGFREGLHKLSFGAALTDQVQLAHRDFAPRWGYTLSAAWTCNPANRDFSDLVSLYGQGYLPGLAPHHSVRMAANYQTSVGGYKFPPGYRPLSYRSTRLIPQGFTSADMLANDYIALALDYQLPVWHPEGGIPSVLYIKRIRLNIGGTWAQFRDLGRRGMERRRIWAAGCDLIFDLNVLRQPASATSTLKLSFYRPSSGKMWMAASVGLPF